MQPGKSFSYASAYRTLLKGWNRFNNDSIDLTTAGFEKLFLPIRGVLRAGDIFLSPFSPVSYAKLEQAYIGSPIRAWPGLVSN